MRVSASGVRRLDSWKARRRLTLFGEPIFGPGIRRVRIPAHLPKSQNITVQEGDFSNELRAFPGVTFGNNNACRAAMFRTYGFPIPFVRNENVVVEADVE